MSRPPCTLPSVLLAAALAAGCASTRTPFPEKVGSSRQFKITVDSLAAPEAAALGRTFLLLPGNRDLREDDLGGLLVREHGARRHYSDEDADYA